LGGALEDSLEHLLDKGVRKREAAVCTDPVPLGELKGNPPFHAFALDKNQFLGQRGREGLLQHLCESIRKDLQAVTREKPDHNCFNASAFSGYRCDQRPTLSTKTPIQRASRIGVLKKPLELLKL
jgi:hypothetical protein